MTTLTAFKAYDVRGRIPTELNETLAYQIGQAYAAFIRPKRVCVGRDIRLSSAQLCEALVRGLTRLRASTSPTSACAAPKASISPPSPTGSTAASWSRPATTRPTTTA